MDVSNEFAGMTPSQIIGTGAILNALLVKENVRRSFLFQPPEYSDGYASTSRGKKTVQYRAKTLKKYIPEIIPQNTLEGIVYSSKSKKSTVSNHISCSKRKPVGIYAVLSDQTMLHLFTMECSLSARKLMDFLKKIHIVFKKHAQMLERIGIYVKTVIAIKEMAKVSQQVSQTGPRGLKKVR
jgi:hypothetical protein